MATPRLAKVRLRGADGGPLRLDMRTSARAGEVRPAVAICHGFKGFKDWGFFPKLAERLAVAGFTAITFNFSGSGVSDGEVFDETERWAHQRPSTDLEDVATVLDWAAGEGAEWCGLVGHSRGGGLSVLHAVRDPRVKALVTWAAVDHFLRWPEQEVARWRAEGRIDVVNQRTGQVLTMLRDHLDDMDANAKTSLDVMAAAARVRVPWLIAHGTDDRAVVPEVGRALGAASGSERTELMLVEGADHTFGIRHPWQGSTPAFDAVLERTVAHLARSLG
jgi:dienelactone hydrolase